MNELEADIKQIDDENLALRKEIDELKSLLPEQESILQPTPRENLI